MKRLILVSLIFLSMAVVSCGGGSGGDAQPSSSWDEMVWDLDNWA